MRSAIKGGSPPGSRSGLRGCSRHIILRAPSGAFPLLPSATGGRSVVAARTDALLPGHKAAAVSPLLTLGRLAVAMLECLAQGDSTADQLTQLEEGRTWGTLPTAGVAGAALPSPARTTQCGSPASNTSMTTLPSVLVLSRNLGPLSPFC